MRKRYLVEELDLEEDVLVKIIAPIVIIGIIILINWNFLKSLLKIDPEVIGILVGIGISLLISCCIFIIKIKDGLGEALEYTIKWTFGLCFFFMLVGSIISPMIAYYIVYKEIEFIFWNFLKTLFYNSLILIVSTPLMAIIITFIVGIIGFILAFPIYKIIYKIKSKRIKKTECWTELKQFFNEIDFKNNIIKFELFQNKIKFEIDKNQEILVFDFKKRGYNDLKKIQQLTLINMIKKETKTPIKIKVELFIYTVYNKMLLKKQKAEENEFLKKRKGEKIIAKRKNKDLQRQKKKEYKNAVKSGKNW